MDEKSSLVDMAVTIASAYVSRNQMSAQDLQGLLRSVHSTLRDIADGHGAARVIEVAAQPAVNPKRSVTAQHLICLEDGKKFKSLKRHLKAHHGLTPGAYRDKWGLAKDYPMVAPAYTETRSRLALENGLGRKRRARRTPKTN